MALTDRQCQALRHPNYLVDDGEHRGLRLVANADGSKTWTYRYNDLLSGKKKQLKLGGYPEVTLSAARGMLREQKQLRHQGTDPRDKRANDLAELRLAEQGPYTVRDMCRDYIEYHIKSNRKRAEEYIRLINKEIVPALGDLPLLDLTRPHVVKLKASIEKRIAEDGHWSAKGGVRTAASVIVELQGAIEKARDLGNFPDERRNPCVGVKKSFSRRDSRKTVLDERQLRDFFAWLPDAAMSQTVKDVLLLELLTAARQGEIVRMRWDKIDFEFSAGPAWHLSTLITKNEELHDVFLSEPAQEILQRRKHVIPEGEFVFPNRYYQPVGEGEVRPARSPRSGPGHVSSKQIGSSQWRAKKGFEHKDWVTHDLRRTSLTTLGLLKCPRLVTAKIANHFDSSSTGVYDRWEYLEERRDFLRKLGDYYLGLGMRV